MLDETTARLAEIIRAEGPAAAEAWLDAQISRSPDDPHLLALRTEFAVVASAFAKSVAASAAEAAAPPSCPAPAGPQLAPAAARGLSQVQRAAIVAICACVILLVTSSAPRKDFGQMLASVDRVFVPVRAESFLNLNEALVAKGMATSPRAISRSR